MKNDNDENYFENVGKNIEKCMNLKNLKKKLHTKTKICESLKKFKKK